MFLIISQYHRGIVKRYSKEVQKKECGFLNLSE